MISISDYIKFADVFGVSLIEFMNNPNPEPVQICVDMKKMHKDDMWLLDYGVRFVKNLSELRNM